MKKLSKVLSFFVALCMLLTMGAFASGVTNSPVEKYSAAASVPAIELAARLIASSLSAEPENASTDEASDEASAEPSDEASAEPSDEASAEPSDEASAEPSDEASAEPSDEASAEPSDEASAEPSDEASAEPASGAASTASIAALLIASSLSYDEADAPEAEPDDALSVLDVAYSIIASSLSAERSAADDSADDASAEPSDEASADPSAEPSGEPADDASAEPSGEPSEEPADDASAEPSEEASAEPSEEASDEPEAAPEEETDNSASIAAILIASSLSAESSGDPSDEADDSSELSETVISVGGKDYVLDVYVIDGEEYVKLSDLAALFESEKDTAGEEVTWADYQEYLIDATSGNAPDPEAFKEQVYAINSWDEMPLDQMPWDQIFTTLGLSTWEQFQAGEAAASQVEGLPETAGPAS